MEFLTHLPPPHHTLRHYDRTAPHSTQAAEIPQPFLDAMSIRETVFVNEQHVPLENEYDADDARSFHWVTYASVATTGGPTAVSKGFGVSSSSTSNTTGSSTSNQNRGSKADRRRSTATASKLPVGTIRLVPPPHPPHPTPSSKNQIDNPGTPYASPGNTPPGLTRERTHEHPNTHNVTGVGIVDSSDPYVKLGRLAILPAYRRLGLGKMLVEAACDWASKHADSIIPHMDATTRERERAHARTRSEENAENAQSGAGVEEGDYLGESIAASAEQTNALSTLTPWKGLVLVHAQVNTQKTYEKWGFVRDEELGTWFEEGIEHVAMWRRVPTSKWDVVR